MNQRSKIPLVRATNGEVLPDWHNLVVEEHHFHRHELENLMYVQHFFAVNLGPAIACEFKREGRRETFTPIGSKWLNSNSTLTLGSYNIASALRFGVTTRGIE